MDPRSLIHDSAFAGSGVPAAAAAGGFNLGEIWQLPAGGGGGAAAGILGARFGRDLGFPENPGAGSGNGNRDLSVEESSVTEHSGRSGGGGGRRRRESSAPAAEATSSGNEVV